MVLQAPLDLMDPCTAIRRRGVFSHVISMLILVTKRVKRTCENISITRVIHRPLGPGGVRAKPGDERPFQFQEHGPLVRAREVAWILERTTGSVGVVCRLPLLENCWTYSAKCFCEGALARATHCL